MSTSQAYFEMARLEREAEEKRKNSPVMTGDVWVDINNFQIHHGFKDKKVSLRFLASQLEFLREELNETVDATLNLNGAEVIDGLVDLIVVAIGTLRFFGNSGRDAWIKVMDANCAKEVGFNDKRPHTDGCDLIKPEGWVKPDLKQEAAFINRMMLNAGADELREMGKILDGQETGSSDRVVVDILRECIDVVRSKSDDYASEVSTVQSADYYPRGIDDFVYMIDVLKRNRQTSILDKARAGQPPNNESLEDTLKDRIIYLALAIEWVRGQCPGQRINVDMFNRLLGEEC